METLNKSMTVREALQRCPQLIPLHLRHPHYDRRTTQGILQRMFPLRTSIELECSNSLADGLMTEGKIERSTDWGTINDSIRKLYELHSFKQDSADARTISQNLIEHRIGLSNYRQALALHNILLDIKRHCLLNDGGGIHLHVDISHFAFTKTDPLKKFMENNLDRINNIFGGYTGKYNKREVGVDKKSTWVNIRTNLKSVEFRIGFCTFEYKTIMNWILECNKLIKEYSHLHNHPIPKESIRKPIDIKTKSNLTAFTATQNHNTLITSGTSANTVYISPSTLNSITINGISSNQYNSWNTDLLTDGYNETYLPPVRLEDGRIITRQTRSVPDGNGGFRTERFIPDGSYGTPPSVDTNGEQGSPGVDGQNPSPSDTPPVSQFNMDEVVGNIATSERLQQYQRRLEEYAAYLNETSRAIMPIGVEVRPIPSMDDIHVTVSTPYIPNSLAC